MYYLMLCSIVGYIHLEGMRTWRVYTFGGYAHLEGIYIWSVYTFAGYTRLKACTLRGRAYVEGIHA